MTDAVGHLVRPVTPELWDELAEFFGRSGAYSNRGWVSVAPRPRFPRVGRSPNLKPSPDDEFGEFADESVWSGYCFWIPRGHRGRGIGRAPLDGAVAYVFERDCRRGLSGRHPPSGGAGSGRWCG